jgi:hypothetical protein
MAVTSARLGGRQSDDGRSGTDHLNRILMDGGAQHLEVAVSVDGRFVTGFVTGPARLTATGATQRDDLPKATGADQDFSVLVRDQSD